MLISVIGIVFGIMITALWIFIPLKNIPREKQISKGVYFRSILLGATLCSLCIFIPEVIWDRVTGIGADTVDNIWKAFATSFLRAALIEELVKFLFVRRVLKKHKPEDKLQYMLLAATIGMGYGILEKLVLSPGAVIFSSFFAFHIMFQFIMGGYLYEAGNAENETGKRRMTIMSFLIPFAVHGTWDTLLFSFEQLLDSDSMVATIIGVAALFLLIVGGIIFEVRVFLYLKKLLTGEAYAETEGARSEGSSV